MGASSSTFKDMCKMRTCIRSAKVAWEWVALAYEAEGQLLHLAARHRSCAVEGMAANQWENVFRLMLATVDPTVQHLKNLIHPSLSWKILTSSSFILLCVLIQSLSGLLVAHKFECWMLVGCLSLKISVVFILSLEMHSGTSL